MKTYRKAALYWALCGSVVLLSLLPPSLRVSASGDRSHVKHLSRSPSFSAHGVGSVFGVGAFVTQRSEAVARLVVARARVLGASWVREEFTASRLHVGPRKPYQWSSYDRIVNQERAAGLHILGLLDYSNTWRFGNHGVVPHTGLATVSSDFAEYAYAVARHFRGRVHYWQVWNEPDLPVFWRPEPDAADYAKLLTQAYKAIKRADPTDTVVMAGTSGVDLGFVHRVVASGGRFDVVSVHPYRNIPEPQLIREVASLRSLHRPIWFSEIGWPAGPGCDLCADEEAQAAYLVRFYTLAAASGVARVFWYDLRDDPHTAESPEAHFGLLRRDLSAKPAFLAYARLDRILRGATFIRADAVNRGGLYALRFRGSRGPIVVLWNTGTNVQSVRLSWHNAIGIAVGMDAGLLDTLPANRSAITVTVPAGGVPFFLVTRPPSLTLPALGPLLHFAPVTGPGGAWVAKPGSTASATSTPVPREHTVVIGGKTKVNRATPTPNPSPTAATTATTATATATL